MMCFQTKDGINIDCQITTAKKFPVLAKLLDKVDFKYTGKNIKTLFLDCIGSEALKVLLLAAERPEDFESCSHNALNLKVLPQNGHSITCSKKVMEEILSLNALGINAKLNYQKANGSGVMSDYVIRLRFPSEAIIESHCGLENRFSEFRLVRFFCGLDKGRVECQVRTARKLMKFLPVIQAKENELSMVHSQWDSVFSIFLDLISAKALGAVVQCAERCDDYEQCSHNKIFLESLLKSSETVCVSQEVLDEILENDVFELDGAFTFQASREKDKYDLKAYLHQEILDGSMCHRDPLEEIINEFHLKTVRVRCRGGKEIEVLRLTIENFKTLANMLRNKEAAVGLGADNFIPCIGINAKVLRTLFEIGIRRHDFNVLLENAPAIFTNIPYSGKTVLVNTSILSELLQYKSLISDCKVKFFCSNVKSFYYVYLAWTNEYGYDRHKSQEYHNFPIDMQLKSEFCIFETKDKKLVEVPVNVLKYFPEMSKSILVSFKNNDYEPFRLNSIGFHALSALVQCASSPNSSIEIHESTLHEIFQLKRNKLFDFHGSIKFLQGHLRGVYCFSVNWHSLSKSFAKNRKKQYKTLLAICKDGRLVRSKINSAKKIFVISELLSLCDDDATKNIFVDFLSAEEFESLLDCVERRNDYELTAENAIYCQRLPKYGRILEVDVNSMKAISECLAEDRGLRLKVIEENYCGRCKIRIILKDEPGFEMSWKADFSKFKNEVNRDLRKDENAITKPKGSKIPSRSQELSISNKAESLNDTILKATNFHSINGISRLHHEATRITNKTRNRSFQGQLTLRLHMAYKIPLLILSPFPLLIINLNMQKDTRNELEMSRSKPIQANCSRIKSFQLKPIKFPAYGHKEISFSLSQEGLHRHSSKTNHETVFHAICKDNAPIFALLRTATKFKILNDLIKKTQNDSHESLRPLKVNFISSKALDSLLNLALRIEDFNRFENLRNVKQVIRKVMEVDSRTFGEIYILCKTGALDLMDNGRIMYKKSRHSNLYKLWIHFENDFKE